MITSASILYPVFAMFLLTIIVMLHLGRLRITAIRSRQISIKFFRAYVGNDEPEYMRVVSRHFVNLFEMPVLFYVGVILVYITGQVTTWLVACAWTYVALRYLHSYVHLTSNNITRRFACYFGSAVALVALWVSLFVRLLAA
ncbi:MAG: MAPEG family protein [Steroidobacteraceae bacterium]